MSDEKQVILVVDDTPENIDILDAVLHDIYTVKAVRSGKQALNLLKKDPKPDMVLLDIMMPEMNGYEVCRQMKKDPRTADIPIIFITALSDREDEKKGLNLGAVDYITKPINPSITKVRIKTHLSLHNQNLELEKKVQERIKELNETRLSIIRQLGRAAEFKDNETGLHIIRMSHYASLIAESMSGGPNEWTNLMFQAAPLHDVGKIGIPDKIMLKPGKLDDDEFRLMQKHPLYGAEIIGEHEAKLLILAKEIALTHHEKFDGSGYPHGLAGEDIPISGRIVAIADVFDALMSKRPYKEAWTIEKTLAYIKENSNKHFDPVVVEHFLKVLPEILKINEKFAETAGSLNNSVL